MTSPSKAKRRGLLPSSTFLVPAVIAFLGAGLSAGLGAGAAYAADLDLTVSGLSPAEGKVAIAVFADAASYKSGDNPVAATVVTVSGGDVTAHFSGLAAGDCAIKVYHDVNGNGKLDTNLVGMPTEPFGFSNGAKASFGPPGFDAARFDLTEGENSHEIVLESMS